MIGALPLYHRVAGRPVIVLGVGDAAEAKRRLVARAGGEPVDDLREGIDRGARLAFVAHDDEGRARADALRARGLGLLVNAADRPELCDFTVPALVARDPVLVAIGTGGASAGLAKALRLRLETLLPPALGALAAALHAARAALRARWPDAGERRRALDAALAEGGALDPLRGGDGDAVARWLAARGGEGERPALHQIALASADPDELTLRAARLLGAADLVAHEPGVPPAILDRARADARRVPIAARARAPEAPGMIVVLRMAPAS